MNFPKMLKIRQHFPRPIVQDIEKTLNDQIETIRPKLNIKSGDTIAIACPSRGIANYPLIIKTLVSKLKEMNLVPFVFPAMGSHGGGTAEGQKETLEHLGITEAVIKAPIKSQLEVIQIGETPEKVPVYIDKLAFEADHVILFNRIKKHTDFVGEIESGLMKLSVIGMGKFEGAKTYHRAMMSYGPCHIIKSGARVVLEKVPVLCGVGVVENGYQETAKLAIMTPDRLEETEKALLKYSKTLSAYLPFDEADILIIDQGGKEIAGSCVDYKVVGRIGAPLFTPEPKSPKIRRILVSDLTPASQGNACGLGIFDLITKRLADKVDRKITDLNIITSCLLEMGGLPCIAENDRDAISILLRCIGLIPTQKVRIMRIKDTLNLENVYVSQAYGKLVEKRDELCVLSGPEDMQFQNDYLLPF